ncbi:MAG: hypothetical protein VKJ04_11050 [Vampirovibrionales bacterium]|nr:hypothetical protein [Vampirovibrionales bacterium]
MNTDTELYSNRSSDPVVTATDNPVLGYEDLSSSDRDSSETISLASLSKRRLLNSAKSLQYATYGRSQPVEGSAYSNSGPLSAQQADSSAEGYTVQEGFGVNHQSSQVRQQLSSGRKFREDYAGRISAEAWASRQEGFYWKIAFAYSLIVYLWVIGFVFAAAFVNFDQAISALLLLPLGFAVHLGAQALAIGKIQANGLRVSLSQFPEIFQMAETIAAKMGLGKLPAIYLFPQAKAEPGFLIEVFSKRLLGKTFIVLPYALLNLADEIESQATSISARQDHLTRALAGSDILRLILARELARARQKHLQGRWLLWPALFTPGLGSAYRRACEISCDRMAAFCEPRGALNGLKILAFGNNLKSCLNIHAYSKDTKRQRSLFRSLAESASSTPMLNDRIEQLLSLPFIQANETRP